MWDEDEDGTRYEGSCEEKAKKSDGEVGKTITVEGASKAFSAVLLVSADILRHIRPTKELFFFFVRISAKWTNIHGA